MDEKEKENARGGAGGTAACNSAGGGRAGVVEGARVHVFGGERVARDQIWRWRRCATSKEGGGVGARRRKREAGLVRDFFCFLYLQILPCFKICRIIYF